MKACKELKTEQNSEEWLLIRRNHITATDIAKIMSINPFSSPLECFLDKIEGKTTFISPAMQHGMDLEPVARAFLENKYFIKLKPKVFESIKYPFLMASVDAITDDNKTLVEIKCPQEKTMAKALKGEIDPMYIYQCQTQMLVTGLESMKIFFYYSDFLYCEHEVKRDETKIEEIIKAATDFWHNNLLKQVPPPKTKENYKFILCDKANDLAKCRNVLYEQEKIIKAEREEIEAKLINMTTENSFFVNAGLKLAYVERKGSIDYKKLVDDKNISDEELEKYRKENTKYNKFNLT